MSETDFYYFVTSVVFFLFLLLGEEEERVGCLLVILLAYLKDLVVGKIGEKARRKEKTTKEESPLFVFVSLGVYFMGLSHSSLSSSDAANTEALLRSRPKLTPEDVQSLPLVSHYVYALLSLHVYGGPNTPPLPSDWEVCLKATDLNLDKEGYFAIAYINKELRQCIIAQRGTTDAMGLRAGVWIYFDEQTILFSLARQFSKEVRLYLNLTWGKTPEWFVSYTGHSLGAVLATCRAVEEQTHAVTFESPGCKNFIEKTMSSSKAKDADIIAYLCQPNPINTLRPHCGYVMQLPFVSEKNVLLRPRVVSSSMLRLPSIPTPQEFIRGQIPRIVGIPDIQQYISRIQPLFFAMLEHTQQVHSMAGIFDYFKTNGECLNERVVLRWPSTFMQFLEYHNAKRALEDSEIQQTNLSSAYESLIRSLYLTAERSKNSLPLRFLNEDSVKILWLWSKENPARLARLPLTLMDHKVLNTIMVEDGCMHTSVLTAFQAKQYLSLLVFRPEMHGVLTQLAFDPLFENKSKL